MDSRGDHEPTETTSLLAHDAGAGANPAPRDDAHDGTETTSDSVLERGAVEPPQSDASRVEQNPELKKTLYLILPAVGLGTFLGGLDQTIVVACYGKIGSDLHALNSTAWIVTAYFITLATIQPLYGKISDVFGRKPALLSAYLVLALGCLLCGLAKNLGEMIAARALAGIGAGGVTTVVSTLLSDMVPLRERGVWQGYLSLIYAAGQSIGAPLGGLLADTIGWRWAFIGQAPLCLVAFCMLYFILELPKVNQSRWKEELAKVDFLGTFGLVIAVSVLLIGLDRGSNEGWSDTTAIVFCSMAVPLFAIFILLEAKIAAFPLIPARIVFERSVGFSYIVSSFGTTAYFASLYYVPLYLQVVDNLSAEDAGIRLIGVTVASVLGFMYGGNMIKRIGKYYWIMVSSMFLTVLSIGFLVLSGGVFGSSWGLIISLAFTCFGGGAAVTATLICMIANIDRKDLAVATACSFLVRSIGAATGISLASVVVQQILRTQLHSRLDASDDADNIADKVRQSIDYIRTLEPHVRDIVISCYVNAITGAFTLAFVYAVLAFVFSLGVREKSLSK